MSAGFNVLLLYVHSPLFTCVASPATDTPHPTLALILVVIAAVSLAGCLVALQASHVLCQVPPRPDSLSRLASHRPFLTKTVSLARASECVAAVGEAFVACVPANAVNQTQFWTATH
jgi:hypothetical protein